MGIISFQYLDTWPTFQLRLKMFTEGAVTKVL